MTLLWEWINELLWQIHVVTVLFSVNIRFVVDYRFKRRSGRVVRAAWLWRRDIARVRGSASPCSDWKTLSVDQAVNGTFFELGKDKAAKGEGWAPPFSCAQDTVGL